MIQANELMIGNLCLRDGKLRIIDVNDISNIWDENRLNPYGHRLVEEISSLYERILLTEEFLTKKFGFKPCNLNQRYKLGKFTYNVNSGWFFGNKKIPNQQYVDQFQNTYFALTQTKLETI